MYDPKGNGKEKTVPSVRFCEIEPPAHLQTVVHRFLELKTDQPLEADYRFHALPDACTYLVFDQKDVRVAGVSRLSAASEELNLGREFHYINIRFLPGVWQDEREYVSYGMISAPYDGSLPLRAINGEMSGQPFAEIQPILERFVEKLIEGALVAPNPVTEVILRHLDEILSVADMARIAGLSTRQLQRTLKRTTGFSPHDFLKILRLQQSLLGEPSQGYADQAHFINSFRKATGYTPGRYSRKFDV